jgi:hypothetical protein
LRRRRRRGRGRCRTSGTRWGCDRCDGGEGECCACGLAAEECFMQPSAESFECKREQTATHGWTRSAFRGAAPGELRRSNSQRARTQLAIRGPAPGRSPPSPPHARCPCPRARARARGSAPSCAAPRLAGGQGEGLAAARPPRAFTAPTASRTGRPRAAGAWPAPR